MVSDISLDLNSIDYSKVGVVSRSHGSSGEVIIKATSDTLHDLLEKKENFTIFMLFDNIYTPFEISELEQRNNNSWIAQFRTIRDAEHAEEIVGKDIFVPSQIEAKEGEGLKLLKGYSLFNQERKKIGYIADIEEYPSNVCLVLNDPNNTLIPIHEDLIIELNEDKKEIYLHIADGLF